MTRCTLLAVVCECVSALWYNGQIFKLCVNKYIVSILCTMDVAMWHNKNKRKMKQTHTQSVNSCIERWRCERRMRAREKPVEQHTNDTFGFGLWCDERRRVVDCALCDVSSNRIAKRILLSLGNGGVLRRRSTLRCSEHEWTNFAKIHAQTNENGKQSPTTPLSHHSGHSKAIRIRLAHTIFWTTVIN